MAHAVSIDTLKASETLQAAGLDATSAKAVVSVISEAIATTAATKNDLDKAEARLTQKIKDSVAELDKKIDTEITELRAEVNIGFTKLDKKIEVQGAQLRTEISDSVNKMTRNMSVLIGLALGLAALWSVFGPVAATLPTP